jgi:hypothetical protein
MSWTTGKAQKSCQLLVILIIWQYIIMWSGNIFRNYTLKIHSSPWPNNVKLWDIICICSIPTVSFVRYWQNMLVVPILKLLMHCCSPEKTVLGLSLPSDHIFWLMFFMYLQEILVQCLKVFHDLFLLWVSVSTAVMGCLAFTFTFHRSKLRPMTVEYETRKKKVCVYIYKVA